MPFKFGFIHVHIAINGNGHNFYVVQTRGFLGKVTKQIRGCLGTSVDKYSVARLNARKGFLGRDVTNFRSQGVSELVLGTMLITYRC